MQRGGEGDGRGRDQCERQSAQRRVGRTGEDEGAEQAGAEGDDEVGMPSTLNLTARRWPVSRANARATHGAARPTARSPRPAGTANSGGSWPPHTPPDVTITASTHDWVQFAIDPTPDRAAELHVNIDGDADTVRRCYRLLRAFRNTLDNAHVR